MQKLPSAVERFRKEVKRVTLVIDAHLKKHGTPYLLGDRVSYADLAFVTWQAKYETRLIPEWDFEKEAPVFAAWRRRLQERPTVKDILSRDQFQAQK